MGLFARVHIYILLLLVVLLVSCSSSRVTYDGRDVLVVAHRGGMSLGPENSLCAIGRSIAVGADAVEVDVRLTADGVPVLMHDAGVGRTTNGKGLVRDFTLAQLRGLRLLDGEGRITDERVPTLEDVLACVDGRCGVLIEVKGDACGIEHEIIRIVELYGAVEWVAVQSFNDGVLERFAALGASFPLEKLLVFKLPLLPYLFDGTLRRFSMEKYGYVSSFNIRKCFIRKGLVDKLKAAGKGVKAWTFKDGRGSFAAPVDGVITDSPQCWE